MVVGGHILKYVPGQVGAYLVGGSYSRYVKTACVGTRNAHLLENEASLYQKLRDLQGSIIPRLLRCGISNGEFHIVTEDVGRSLNRLPPRDVDCLARKMAESLDAVHQRGVLVGDVDLSNFTLNGQNVFLIDFGQGRLATEENEFREEDAALQHLISSVKSTIDRWTLRCAYLLLV